MSMNLYLIRADVAFGNVLIPDEADREMIRERDGYRSSASWTPSQGEADDGFIPTDCVFSYATGRMLLNRRARDALDALLSPCGEFLPVRLRRYDYAWFNCWTELDAADWERCEGEGRRNRTHGRFYKKVWRYEFFPDRVVDPPALFRLDRGNLDLFCTGALRDAVERAGLTGFEFDRTWSADTGGVRLPPRGFDLIGPEAMRLRRERNEQVRRNMLDRMAADNTIAALPTMHR